MNKREFKRKLDDLVRTGVRKEWSASEFKRQLSKFFKESGFLESENKALLLSAEKKFAALFITTAGAEVRRATAEIISKTGDLYKLVGQNVSNRMGSHIVRALREGLTTDQTTNLIRDKVVELADYQIRGIVRTSQTAFDTASVIAPAIDAGIEKFKYVGPKPERLFCSERIDKVYTLAQIERMDNHQGLSVLYFRGGYNCQHGWEPYFEIKKRS